VEDRIDIFKLSTYSL